MNTRLKIDMTHGLLEVEGNETFVKSIYDEFKHGILNKDTAHHSDDKPRHEKKIQSKIEKEKKSGKQKRKTTTYRVVKDLDLSAKKNKQSFKEFVSLKAPSTDKERNTVFIYYLQKIAGIEGITADYIYTCYKEVGNLRVPENLKQSLFNSAHRGWLDTSNLLDIKLTTAGENFIDHDLPKKE